MSEQVAEVRDLIWRVLADHQWADWSCSCGKVNPASREWEDNHLAGVMAEALAPLIAERGRAAAERALRDAADAFSHMWQADNVPAPVACRALRQRATDLSAQNHKGEEIR